MMSAAFEAAKRADTRERWERSRVKPRERRWRNKYPTLKQIRLWKAAYDALQELGIDI
jgi:hypothetical protein